MTEWYHIEIIETFIFVNETFFLISTAPGQRLKLATRPFRQQQDKEGDHRCNVVVANNQLTVANAKDIARNYSLQRSINLNNPTVTLNSLRCRLYTPAMSRPPNDIKGDIATLIH